MNRLQGVVSLSMGLALMLGASGCVYEFNRTYDQGAGKPDGPVGFDGTQKPDGMPNKETGPGKDNGPQSDTVGRCGNGTINTGEKCDGAKLNGKTCGDLGFGFGELKCTPKTCVFDTSGCDKCGDGTIDPGEKCDGKALGNQTCKGLGYAKGTLTCSQGCTLDTSGCSGGWTSLECGWGVCFAKRFDDKWACWGGKTECAFGGGSDFGRPHFPSAMPSGFTQISAGAGQVCVRKKDATLWCWGGNGSGQLGDGSTTRRDTPVQVKKLTAVSQVSAGRDFTCAVESTGKAWCWGDNNYGKLGNGNSTRTQTQPTEVKGITDAAQIAASTWMHGCLKTTGKEVTCWGANTYGQLGTSAAGSNTPAKIPGFTDVRTIYTAGFGGTEGRSYAITTNGELWAWGANNKSQLGLGGGYSQKSPKRLLPTRTFDVVASGDDHSCAVETNGDLWCWGGNGGGQVGDGSTTTRSTPVKVLSGVKTVGAGFGSVCALMTDSTVRCWGGKHPTVGQGKGLSADVTKPTDILPPWPETTGSACTSDDHCLPPMTCHIPSGTKGYCTHTCATLGVACSDAPARTTSTCALTSGSKNYCGFVCKQNTSGGVKTSACPTGLTCSPAANPSGSGVHFCVP